MFNDKQLIHDCTQAPPFKRAFHLDVDKNSTCTGGSVVNSERYLYFNTDMRIYYSRFSDD